MTPTLEFVTTLTVELSRPLEIVSNADSARRIIPIVGGLAEGPMLSGEIVDLGADWQTVSGDIAQLDARYAVRTQSGCIVQIESQGLRVAEPKIAARIASGEDVSPNEYYMRTAIRLTSGDPELDWVNRAIFVSSGGKNGTTVRLDIYRVT